MLFRLSYESIRWVYYLVCWVLELKTKYVIYILHVMIQFPIFILEFLKVHRLFDMKTRRLFSSNCCRIETGYKYQPPLLNFKLYQATLKISCQTFENKSWKLISSNFSFCHTVLKSSAADVSESVYTWETVNLLMNFVCRRRCLPPVWRGKYIHYILFYSFPTYRRFLTPLQPTIFLNIVANGEIAHDEQFLILPQCLQLY